MNYNIKRDLEQKLSILSLVDLTYKLIFFNLEVLIALPIFFGLVFLVSKFNLISNLNLILIIKPTILLIMALIIEKRLYNRKNFSSLRILVFLIIVYILQYIFVYFIFMTIPLMYLLRKVNLRTSISISIRIINKNIIKIVMSSFCHLVISIVVAAIPISIYFIYTGAIPETILVDGKLVNPEFYNIFAKYIVVYVSYIFGIHYYLMYKHLEHMEILKGTKHE